MSETAPAAGSRAPWRRQAQAFLILILTIAAWSMRTIEAPLEARIALGFFVFLIAPGALVLLIVLPRERLTIFERLPLALVLSLGVTAPLGLIAYRFGTSLAVLARHELALIGVLAMAAFAAPWFINPPEVLPDRRLPRVHRLTLLIIGLLLAGLAWHFGALRGPSVDWDLFNYVSEVRKLVSWSRADLAHFAYRDAPPDPVHSYNCLALQWALIARLYAVDPIALYLRSAFITIPAAAFAFFGMARKLAGDRAAIIALLLYAAYHVIYGGLVFLGRTTFYPADSQWLIAFPAAVWLFALAAGRREIRERAGLFAALALAVLGLSVNHVLWGLAFYLTLAGAFALNLLYHHRAGAALHRARRETPGLVIAAAVPLLIPYALSALAAAVMNHRGQLLGFDPLTSSPLLDQSPWLYALLFVILPLGLLAYTLYARAPRPEVNDDGADHARLIITAIIGCLIIAIPYLLLRHEATQATAWSQFGRNPYRARLTAGIFFLNPFQLTLTDPNMTFYPLGLLGYLTLPWLFVRARSRALARLALAGMLIPPLIAMNPVLATLFANFFSLGYLRRILRLAAIFSFIPIALFLDWLLYGLLGRGRTTAALAAAAVISVLLAMISIPFPAEPSYYNHLLTKSRIVAREYPPLSLTFDDEPFRLIREHCWFDDQDVIFSDLWTSYRLTAYLPQFVAVQEKPGTGVADQDERRLLEDEFFHSDTPLSRLIEILDHFEATGVIINLDPNYHLYQFSRGRPEIAANLKTDPFHFQVLAESAHWAVLRYRPHGPPPEPEKKENSCPMLK